MAKFNEIQKKKRAQNAVWKRAIHGDPKSGKLTNKPQGIAISGKRKQKLIRKMRRDQKDALQKGLLTLHDVEMADGEKSPKEAARKFPMKKKALKLKHRGKGKRKPSESCPAKAPVDLMLE